MFNWIMPWPGCELQELLATPRPTDNASPGPNCQGLLSSLSLCIGNVTSRNEEGNFPLVEVHLNKEITLQCGTCNNRSVKSNFDIII